jgi:hypothetical protein
MAKDPDETARFQPLGNPPAIIQIKDEEHLTTCELCNRGFNAATFNAASNPHRCEPEALVARILALKDALKSERKTIATEAALWARGRLRGSQFSWAPSGPCDCGAAPAEELLDAVR